MNNYWLYNITEDHSKFRDISAIDVNSLTGFIDVTNFDEGIGTRKGDFLLTLNRNGAYYFNHYGQVIGDIQTSKADLTAKERDSFAKRFNSVDKYPQKYIHSVPVTLNKIHEKLEDYLYSLIAIENYTHPYNHFKRKVTSLSKADYETITEKLIYIARTTFGRLVNCLPRDNQFEILLSLMEEEGHNDIRNIGYLKAIRYLKDFINNNIVDTGHYLISIENLVTEIFGSLGVDISRLGFGLDENLKKIDPLETNLTINTNVDLVIEQVIFFKNLFELEYDLSIVDEIEQQILATQEIQQRFEKLFQRRRWPLNITI